MNNINLKKASQWYSESEITIPFHDVDLLEVAWHGHYAKYFEIARGHLMDTINYNYVEMKKSGYAWPIIDMHIRYIASATLGQTVKIACWVHEYEHRLTIHYLMTDPTTGKRLAKGHTQQVAVDWPTREMCLVSPDILFEKLEVKRD